jgi:hypothetical protein
VDAFADATIVLIIASVGAIGAASALGSIVRQRRLPLVQVLQATDGMPMNTVAIGAHAYLHVVTGNASLIHLAPGVGEATEGTLWTARTMCGLPWVHMASYDEEMDAVARTLGDPRSAGAIACIACVTYAEREPLKNA